VFRPPKQSKKRIEAPAFFNNFSMFKSASLWCKEIMSIPRKGSRRITVDGQTYLWRVRGKPTYSQALAWTPLMVGVEQEGVRGSTLIIRLDAAHPSNWVNAPRKAVTPGVVEAHIRTALKQGWEPTARGAQFCITAHTAP
jgi:hypothetical protein